METIKSYRFPLPRNVAPSLKRAEAVIRALRGPLSSKNDNHQASAIVVLADGKRNHFLSYVKNRGGSFRDGVRVEQIGVAIYENTGRLADKQEGMDRELCRDYVLKPLMELGIVVSATWCNDGQPQLLYGHPKAKSPNCVYRLADEVIDVLDAKEEHFQEQLNDLKNILPKAKQERLVIERLVAASQCDQAHGTLVKACASIVHQYADDFKLVFLDLTDGQRISQNYQDLLAEHGLSLTLADNVPDAILASIETKQIISIEGVTSDGEFDEHRFNHLHKWAQKHSYSVAAAITAYPDYDTFARRQGKHKNIANGSFIWIMSHPECLFNKDQITDALSRCREK